MFWNKKEERSLLMGEDGFPELQLTSSDLQKFESYTVEWKVYSSSGYTIITHRKTFVYKEDAEEFKRRLKAAADFIKSWIEVKIVKS